MKRLLFTLLLIPSAALCSPDFGNDGGGSSSGGGVSGGVADYVPAWSGATSISTATSDGNVIRSTGTGTLMIYNTLHPGTTFYFDWTAGAFGINQMPSNISTNLELIRATRNSVGNTGADAGDIISVNSGSGSTRHVSSCEGSATQTTSYLNAFGQGQTGSWWTGGPLNANTANIELQNGTNGQLIYAFGGSAHTYIINETADADWFFGTGWPPTEEFAIGASSVTIPGSSQLNMGRATAIRGTITPVREGSMIWDSTSHCLCTATGTVTTSWTKADGTTACPD